LKNISKSFFMIYCFLMIYNIFHKFRSLFGYKLVWYVFEKKFEIWWKNYFHFWIYSGCDYHHYFDLLRSFL